MEEIREIIVEQIKRGRKTVRVDEKYLRKLGDTDHKGGKDGKVDIRIEYLEMLIDRWEEREEREER